MTSEKSVSFFRAGLLPRVDILFFIIYRVYQKKLNRFEIALNFAKQPLVSSL
jgi:hypothetical protein